LIISVVAGGVKSIHQDYETANLTPLIPLSFKGEGEKKI
jgi:hypothetical protein